MNTDNLIEQIHAANAQRRVGENGERRAERGERRTVWRIAIPTAAAAAILLVVFLPRHNEAQVAAVPAGIYCNSQCSPDDVIALIDNNVNHIKEIQQS